MWTRISRSSLASLCSRRLWSRSYWFLWDSGVSAFVLNVLAWTIQESHVKVLLVFVHVVSEDEVARLLGLFLEPNDFAHDVCGDAVLIRSRCFFVRLTGKSCSALFTLLVKTELVLALVRFWCFIVSSIQIARRPNRKRRLTNNPLYKIRFIKIVSLLLLVLL